MNDEAFWVKFDEFDIYGAAFCSGFEKAKHFEFATYTHSFGPEVFIKLPPVFYLFNSPDPN